MSKTAQTIASHAVMLVTGGQPLDDDRAATLVYLRSFGDDRLVLAATILEGHWAFPEPFVTR
jgi:hypothetical protein